MTMKSSTVDSTGQHTTPTADQIREEQDTTSEQDIQADNVNVSDEETIATLKLPLEINGVTYIFEYIPTSVEEERQSAAEKLAGAFCSTHGDALVREHSALKSLTAAEGESPEAFELRWSQIAGHLLRSECLAPIAGALTANMQRTL